MTETENLGRLCSNSVLTIGDGGLGQMWGSTRREAVDSGLPSSTSPPPTATGRRHPYLAPGFPSGEGSTYYVYADGVLERRWAWFGDRVQVTLPRQRSNTTIRYTVESDRWNASTPPVALTLPTSNDSTPPTDPVWIKAAMGEVCDEFSITITEESTDDVTPRKGSATRVSGSTLKPTRSSSTTTTYPYSTSRG